MDLSPHARPVPLPNPGTLPRVAILIDGDNIPRSDLNRVEDAGARMGRVALRRVFADISIRKDWSCESVYLVTHCTTKNGKNRADMQMAIAALDIAHRGLASAFIIASDDSDFGPLIAHLTEQGFAALRIRKSVAVQAVPEAVPIAPVDPVPAPAPPKANPVAVETVAPEMRVRQIITQSVGKAVLIASLNTAIKGFRISETPEKNWRNWLTAKGFACDPKGPNACVRIAAKIKA